ncbi:threonylcarbamoyl-AMP synthase [Pseudorhodobacter turbinis]|uniref:Threonylcarbamoyl-AMP synthase n=1 Tax=Pseudorhodobacter turbinis TaxID=2500533 RepID=A0A4P8EGJ0_9RHOB|nr:L-threonylcarbamoyladenylate synthase [Pseudorhodobacter turbinis]QCO56270.1 threonylcarbamoyl-AMP synthase [Pseudorhodobacter turbinis]
MQITTQSFGTTADDIAAAAGILRAGGLVGFATETVYGLGGDARNDRAVARIFEAKGRPHFNPLIVHLPDWQSAQAYAVFSDQAKAIAAEFWPGPLTLVLPLVEGSGLSPLVTAGLDSVAIRVPAHPVACALLRAFGGPLAAPSANPSGRVSPTRAAHVMAGLSGRIEAVLDAGACAVGVESTILGLVDGPVLLRPGGLAAEALEAALGTPLTTGGNAHKPSAPGQLASHYAPEAAVRLNVTTPAKDELWVGFGPQCAGAQMSLSPSGDLVEAAANLFHILREADSRAGGSIAFAPVPEVGLGRAINDRLRRAAAPRP